MSQLDRAIEIVMSSRHTHVQWARWLRAAFRCCDGCRTWAEDSVKAGVGDVEHHERCIADYDVVLAVLRGEA